MDIIYIIGGLLYNLFRLGYEDGQWTGFIIFVVVCVLLSVFGNAIG